MTTMTTTTTMTEWKLYVVALLAGVYLLAWRAVATPAPRAEAEPAPPPSAAPPIAFEPPPGWQLVTRDRPAVRAPAPTRVVRAPARRRVRVRTRSS